MRLENCRLKSALLSLRSFSNNFQIRQTRGETFDADRLEDHVHEFIVAVHAGVEDDALAPGGMLDARPGAKLCVDNRSRFTLSPIEGAGRGRERP